MSRRLAGGSITTHSRAGTCPALLAILPYEGQSNLKSEEEVEVDVEEPYRGLRGQEGSGGRALVHLTDIYQSTFWVGARPCSWSHICIMGIVSFCLS